eukprot:1959930-Prymnesium_polylepis.1
MDRRRWAWLAGPRRGAVCVSRRGHGGSVPRRGCDCVVDVWRASAVPRRPRPRHRPRPTRVSTG